MNRIPAPASNVRVDYAPRSVKQRIARALRMPACKPANHYGVLCERTIGGRK